VPKILRYLALAAAVAGAVTAALAAGPASAAARTVVYICGMAGHWTCPAVRPAEIGFGARYDVDGLSWPSWGTGSAHGRGHYYGFGSYNATVTLYGVRVYHGQRYFSWIRITASHHKTRYLQYSGGLWHTR
jgi:hypothetical protein